MSSPIFTSLFNLPIYSVLSTVYCQQSTRTFVPFSKALATSSTAILNLESSRRLHGTFSSTAPTMSSPSSPSSASPSNPSNQPQNSIMAPRNRSRGRNVHIYDTNDRSTILGGLILTNGVTNANFYYMVEILVLFTSNFELRDESNIKIERNDGSLRPGKYYINAASKFLRVLLCLTN
jgi:hypothetical protein